LSTLALNDSSPVEEGGRLSLVVRYADLGLLAIALPVFLVFGFPILGYVVFAAAWLAGRWMHLIAERHATASLGRGNRKNAMGTIAAATLGRVWLLALAILLVGLADREAGLAAAVLAVPVVTVYFAGLAIGRMLEPEEHGS
jgi:hypothetical protein